MSHIQRRTNPPSKFIVLLFMLKHAEFGFDYVFEKKIIKKQGGCSPPIKLKHKIPGYDYFENFEPYSEEGSSS